MKSFVVKSMKHDVLKDSFFHILICLGLPIFNASIVSIFATTAMNEIYSGYVGQVGFSVMGALNMILMFGNSITGSVALAAWIKGAYRYGGDSQGKASKHCMNSIYTLILLALGIIAVLLLGQNFFFQMMNVPTDIWIDAKEYFFIYVWEYLFYGGAMFLSYINNAKGSSKAVLFSNIWLPCSGVIIAFLFLGVFKMGVQGVALTVVVQYLLWMVVNYILLRKQGILGATVQEFRRLDSRLMGTILRYGLLLAGQMMLCCIAEIVVSLQTNRYLSVEYIAVIAVTLPIQGLLNVSTSLCVAFIPQNYRTGNTTRLKDFMRKMIMISVGYAFFCFVIYAAIGKWYFGRLFQNTDIVSMGAEYWFWLGLSMIPNALIGILRTFFDSIDKGNISMLSGIGELLGRVVCGFWLIPCFGNIGRSLAPLMGWGTGALLLIVAYGACRRRVYKKCNELAEKSIGKST